MGAAAYRRGSRAITDSIAREHGLRVDGDTPKHKAVRPQSYGTIAKVRAEEKARGLVRGYLVRSKPLPSVEDLAEAVESFARVGRETARAAATVALNEQEQRRS